MKSKLKMKENIDYVLNGMLIDTVGCIKLLKEMKKPQECIKRYKWRLKQIKSALKDLEDLYGENKNE